MLENNSFIGRGSHPVCTDRGGKEMAAWPCSCSTGCRNFVVLAVVQEKG